MLVLALALGFAGLLSFPMTLRPVLPWFGGLLTGPAGSVATLVTGAVFDTFGSPADQVDGWHGIKRRSCANRRGQRSNPAA